MASSARTGAAQLRSDARPPSESLQRLRRGDITLDQYLDERTEKALDHVRGKVSAETLELVRATVRDQLRTDPVLVELVRRATGLSPDPISEDTV